MKVTIHNARIDSLGVHNDRNFESSRAMHIDGSKTEDNRYWTYNGDEKKTFRDIEMGFYKEHFTQHIKKQNEVNKSYYKSERNMTLPQYYKHASHRPEDVILQVGDKNEHISGDDLWKCAMEYVKQFDEKYGKFCKILTVALHMDEATPHVHIRRAWVGKDKWGLENETQTGALELYAKENNIKLKGDSSKNNNFKILFTKQEREIFVNVCKEKLPEVELELEKPNKREHVSTKVYKQIAKEQEEKDSRVFEHTRLRLEAEIKKLAKELEDEKAYAEKTENLVYNIYRHENNIRKKYKKKLEEYKDLEKDDPRKFEILKQIYIEEFEGMVQE